MNRNPSTFVTTLSALACVVALVACERSAEPRASIESVGISGTVPHAAVNVERAADAVITAAVNEKLSGDPKLSTLHIDVDTVNGRVELRGSTPNRLSRDRAEHLAAAVVGVISVDNQLTVGGRS